MAMLNNQRVTSLIWFHVNFRWSHLISLDRSVIFCWNKLGISGQVYPGTVEDLASNMDPFRLGDLGAESKSESWGRLVSIFMWVCRNVMFTTHQIDGWNHVDTTYNIFKKMVMTGGWFMALLYQHYMVSQQNMWESVGTKHEFMTISENGRKGFQPHPAKGLKWEMTIASYHSDSCS